jgi:hypothetical protein
VINFNFIRHLYILSIDGVEKGQIENPHSLLVRGIGLFGPYFFSYGDDRKLNFYMPNGTVEYKAVQENKPEMSEMEMMQADMVSDQPIKNKMRKF